jgi:hypothetical protein
MKSFPEMFCVWITKQLLHFNGTNCQLSLIDCTGTVKKMYPSYGCRDKSPGHITNFGDPGRTLVFHDSIGSIVQWVEDQKTGPDLVAVIRSYLLARGIKSAVSLLHPESAPATAATTKLPPLPPHCPRQRGDWVASGGSNGGQLVSADLLVSIRMLFFFNDRFLWCHKNIFPHTKKVLPQSVHSDCNRNS